MYAAAPSAPTVTARLVPDGFARARVMHTATAISQYSFTMGGLPSSRGGASPRLSSSALFHSGSSAVCDRVQRSRAHTRQPRRLLLRRLHQQLCLGALPTGHFPLPRWLACKQRCMSAFPRSGLRFRSD